MSENESWNGLSYRQSIVNEINKTLREYNSKLNGFEMENEFCSKSKNKDEYLSSVARFIIEVRKSYIKVNYAKIMGQKRDDDVPSDPNLCCICLDNNANSVLIPCGHLTLCCGCAEMQSKLKPNRCPICRSKVNSFIKTYKP